MMPYHKLTMELCERDRMDPEAMKSLRELRKILKRAGVDVSGENGQVVFAWHDQDVDSIQARGAGRKKMYIKGTSIDEIKERMKSGETAEDIAAELGISRATLFRRLKENA